MPDAEEPAASLFDRLASWADIQALIDRPEPESETLEYKSGRLETTYARDPELSKDVAAFANSSGGVMIFGVSTRKEKGSDRTLPEKPDYLAGDKANLLKTIIADRAMHPVPGIRYRDIADGDRGSVFVVHIPQSGIAPHQARDHKYYHRQGAKSEPMAHNLVELHFGRRSQARLHPRTPITPKSFDGQQVRFDVPLQFTNMGGRIGRDVFCRLTVLDSRIPPRLEQWFAETLKVDARQSPSGAHVIEVRFSGAVLFYPGVPLLAGVALLEVPRDAVGSPGPLALLDVWTDEAVPARFHAILTQHPHGGVQLEWTGVGVPRLPVEA